MIGAEVSEGADMHVTASELVMDKSALSEQIDMFNDQAANH